MSTAEAILNLREKLPGGRKELAHAIGVSERTIIRYEKGQEPPYKVLRLLATFAKTKDIEYLADLFESKKRADIISAREKTSAGSERRIPLNELAEWDNKLSKAYWDFENSGAKMISDANTRGFIGQLMGLIEDVRAQIHFHVTPDEQSNNRKEFDHLLSQRLTPDGKLDLTGASLASNVQGVSVTPEGIAFHIKPEISGTKLYWVDGPWPGRLALASRPRGGDWLPDEITTWRRDHVDTICSLLTPEEEKDLDIVAEAAQAKAQGMKFLSFPILDRHVPKSEGKLTQTLQKLEAELDGGRNVVLHCRQGVGRTGLVAACLLLTKGLDPESAVKRISAARGVSVPETPEQRQWIEKYYANTLAGVQ